MEVTQEDTSFIKKDCAKPIYAQVEDYLRHNINTGHWKESDRIPSEAELIKTLGVSRGSIKKAISNLVAEGSLEQIQGKGTYIKAHDISFPLTEGLISFSEALRSQGIEYETTVICSETRKATKELAEYLSISVDAPYLHLERVRSVDGDPIMYIENNINSILIPGAEVEDFEKDSLFSVVERLSGHKVAYSKTSFIATAASDWLSDNMQVEPKSPLLQQIQTVYLDNDTAIEHARVWLKTNRFYLGTIFQRHK